MKTEIVEIYSDASNTAIIRHPSRKFPGMLIQGDSLHSLSIMATNALAGAEPDSDHWHDIKELADDLQARIDLYKKVMLEHGLPVPF